MTNDKECEIDPYDELGKQIILLGVPKRNIKSLHKILKYLNICVDSISMD